MEFSNVKAITIDSNKDVLKIEKDGVVLWQKDTKITTNIRVSVSVSYPYEHPMAVSGTVKIKQNQTVVGSGSYSGTHMYGFSTTLNISCTYDPNAGSLIATCNDAYPNGWDPKLTILS